MVHTAFIELMGHVERVFLCREPAICNESDFQQLMELRTRALEVVAKILTFGPSNGSGKSARGRKENIRDQRVGRQKDVRHAT